MAWEKLPESHGYGLRPDQRYLSRCRKSSSAIKHRRFLMCSVKSRKSWEPSERIAALPTMTSPCLARVRLTLSNLLFDTMPRWLSQICWSASSFLSGPTTTSVDLVEWRFWQSTVPSATLRTKLMTMHSRSEPCRAYTVPTAMLAASSPQMAANCSTISSFCARYGVMTARSTARQTPLRKSRLQAMATKRASPEFLREVLFSTNVADLDRPRPTSITRPMECGCRQSTKTACSLLSGKTDGCKLRDPMEPSSSSFEP
mmetsp:Transcript_45313/g.121993  ORF Transcript_45313/g.121993 Transcript_45313/m.121993 type:complete len:258 (-) Transcript_45313:125-898(-)